MGRNRSGGEGERTMAEAEQAAREEKAGAGTAVACVCGSQRFVVEAYLEVDGGAPNPEPIEVEALTCPECGREYDAIVTDDGRILRGEFRGYFEDDED